MAASPDAIRRAVWEGSISVRVLLDPSECRVFDKADAYYFQASRVAYLPFYLPRIYKFFEDFLIDRAVATAENAWFEADNAPLRWHWPIGLLYDFYTALDPTKTPTPPSPTNHDRPSSPPVAPDAEPGVPQVPWTITLRFASYPHDLLTTLTPTSTHDSFINTIKEADFARNGTAKAVMSLSPTDSRQLFASLQEHDFDGFWSVSDKMLNHSGSSIRNVPLRIYNPETGQVIQGSIPIRQAGTFRGGDPQTLGGALNSLAPMLFPSKRSVILARPVMHGIVLPMAAPLVDLMREAMYPDGFLHITLAMIRGDRIGDDLAPFDGDDGDDDIPAMSTSAYKAQYGDYYPQELEDLLAESQEAYKNTPERPDYASCPPEKTVPDGWPTQLPPSPMIWDAETFPTDGSHVLQLSDDDIAEVELALAHVEDLVLPPSSIDKTVFPLPRLGPRLDAACRSVYFGLGLVFVRGVPSHKYTADQNVLILLGISSYFGETRGRQRDDGARLIHIFHAATRGFPENLSPIFNNHAQVFHSDIATDVLCMYCIAAATTGGSNSYASIPRIYNHLATHNPEVIRTLAAPDWPFDTYGYTPPFHTRPLLFYTPPGHEGPKHAGSQTGRISTSLSPRQLAGSKVHPRPTEIPALTPPQLAALAELESLARKYCITETLSSGDLVFVNNLAVLHNRTAYADDATLPARSHRHLIRLFLRDEQLAWPTPRELLLDWGRVFGGFDGDDELWVADHERDFFEQQRGLITVTAGGEGGDGAD
ncbi:hypothetical protein DRE_06609 [Drechslerella stenobrocha 248]|uniref:Autophagy protein 5 n=1 Tax=Drechslerella stenobrocha 248 TaxID=1043628 RepID=W7I6V2_9PEZI|nr:hypothetical protein DRE_06609 [Drechslerella stenobrocha 248]